MLSGRLFSAVAAARSDRKAKLLGITKRRSSKYLRKLIIQQGARAALPSLSRTATPLGSWLRGCSVVRMATRLSLRWRASWCGSPGHCCARRPRPPPVGLRRDFFIGIGHDDQFVQPRLSGCCRLVGTDLRRDGRQGGRCTDSIRGLLEMKY
jgi:hypothetical protein